MLLPFGDTTQHRSRVIGVNEEPLGLADLVPFEETLQVTLGFLSVTEE